MTAIEVILIFVGVVIMVGSFFVQEKLTNHDIEEIADMSEKELNIIVEKKMKNANEKVDEAITNLIDESMDLAARAMEKETNEKIMAINEFSDTVLENMNKTHNEIMFLYSMLNDKHEDLTRLANEIQSFTEKINLQEPVVVETRAAEETPVEAKLPETELTPDFVLPEESFESNEEFDDGNHNDLILRLHNQGVGALEIAKQLGLGVGEVKLVIGLFKGESN